MSEERRKAYIDMEYHIKEIKRELHELKETSCNRIRSIEKIMHGDGVIEGLVARCKDFECHVEEGKVWRASVYKLGIGILVTIIINIIGFSFMHGRLTETVKNNSILANETNKILNTKVVDHIAATEPILEILIQEKIDKT